MAMKCPNCVGEAIAAFGWADDSDIEGSICLDCFAVFDLVDNADDAEGRKGKKIGHKKNKYKKAGERLQTWHIREKDKKEPKKVKGGQI